MFGLGFGEVLIIFIFALVFIGPKKLPDLAKALGKGLREFQRARQDLMDQIQDSSHLSSERKVEKVENGERPNNADKIEKGETPS